MKATVFILAILCFTSTGQVVHAAPSPAEFVLSIGVRDYPLERNALNASDAGALVIQRAVSTALVENSNKTGSSASEPDHAIHMRLADKLEVSADYKRWAFRVLSSAQHSNGQAVDGIDVVASVERCRALGQLPHVESISHRRVDPHNGRHAEEWVDFTLNLPVSRADSLPIVHEFSNQLAQCPIFSGTALKGFGADFGYAANIVGPGDYMIDDVRGSREIRLTKVSSSLAPASSPAALILRAFPSDSAALATLRSGGIDLFVGAGAEVVALASRDETLAIAECQGFTVIKRHDLQFSCLPQLNLRGVAYPQR